MRRSSSFLTAVILILVMLIPTGCMSSYYYGTASRFCDDFLREAEKNIDSAVCSYSSSKSASKILRPEQYEVFSKSYSLKLLSLSLDIGDDNRTGILTIETSDKVLGDDLRYITVKDCIDRLSKAQTKTNRYDINMENKDGKWSFTDLDDFYKEILAPYKELRLLDDHGDPYIPEAEYFKSIFLDVLWYDPVTSLPLKSVRIENPVALQCAFYFQKPVTSVFTCELTDQSGNVVLSQDLKTEDSVILICDASLNKAGLLKFAKGKYKMRLLFDGTEIASTADPITVM